jgi:hypothetical protein
MDFGPVGMMKFTIIWKNQIHVPNHQPVVIFVEGHFLKKETDAT